MAWQRQARQRGEAGGSWVGGVGGAEIRVRGGRQARKKQIILLCTVCRLNLRSSGTRQIGKGINAVKYVSENDFTNKTRHTCDVRVRQWIQTNLQRCRCTPLLPYGPLSQFGGSSRIMNLNTSKEKERLKKDGPIVYCKLAAEFECPSGSHR